MGARLTEAGAAFLPTGSLGDRPLGWRQPATLAGGLLVQLMMPGLLLSPCRAGQREVWASS